MTKNSNMDKYNNRVYEVQYFWKQPVSWIVWIVCIGLVYVLWEQEVIYSALGIITLIMLAGVLAISTLTNLVTEVNAEGVSYKMWPFQGNARTISWDDIASAEVRRYKPIAEYGGWGVRAGTKGTAYNVGGNIGLQLELTSGKRILIGTQKPSEIEEILELVSRQ